MANLAGTPKKVVIRTSRETLGLVAAATAMTFALSYAVHSKHDASAPAPTLATATAPMAQEAVVQPQQDWAGHLAELSEATPPAPGEPMTSASLTVPKSQLALPTAPKPVARPRPCPEAPCAAKTTPAAAGAAKRQVASAGDSQRHEQKRSLIGMLNPLNHLPDLSAVGRPFTYAGGAVTSWFKRL